MSQIEHPSLFFDLQCVTLDQLHLLCQVGLTFDERSTKVTIMSILGRLGKLVLGRRDEGVADMLQVRITERILLHYLCT